MFSKETIINMIVVLFKQIIKSDVWSVIFNAVLEESRKDIPGETKRLNVLEEIKNNPISKDFQTFLLNLAIELAVAKSRPLLEKLAS